MGGREKENPDRKPLILIRKVLKYANRGNSKSAEKSLARDGPVYFDTYGEAELCEVLSSAAGFMEDRFGPDPVASPVRKSLYSGSRLVQKKQKPEGKSKQRIAKLQCAIRQLASDYKPEKTKCQQTTFSTD